MLTISIFANVFLVVRWNSAEHIVLSAPESSRLATSSSKHSIEVDQPSPIIDLRDIKTVPLKVAYDKLKKFGLSESVLRGAIQELIKQKLAGEFREIAKGEASCEFWIAETFSVPLMLETQFALKSLDSKKHSMFAEVFGDNQIFGSSTEIAQKRRLYGNLSDEKISKLERIVSTHSLALSANKPDRLTIESLAEKAKLKELVDETESQIETLLTDTEYFEYAIRTSPSSNELRMQLKNIDVTEEEYRSLFRLQLSARSKSTDASLVKSLKGIELINDSDLVNILGANRYSKLRKL